MAAEQVVGPVVKLCVMLGFLEPTVGAEQVPVTYQDALNRHPAEREHKGTPVGAVVHMVELTEIVEDIMEAAVEVLVEPVGLRELAHHLQVLISAAAQEGPE